MNDHMDKIAVKTTQLSKSFDSEQSVVHQLNLEVRSGEILVLLGPSGCGKTTTLRLIAGFERPDAGSIKINDRLIAGEGVFLPPEKREVGMVFQDYALFPHLTIQENVGFGLSAKPQSESVEIVTSMLELVGLQHYASRFPHELSGGQRQRVALARALAPQPLLLLLDEPFSNLDADLRTQMRVEVREILKSISTTAIFVTHDQEEALYLGDRIALLNHGRLAQIGHPEEVFHQPATRFVADFMGSTDFLPGVVQAEGIMTEIGLIPQQVDLPAGTPVEIAVRYDDLDFKVSENGDSHVAERHFRGALNVYRLRLPSGRTVPAYTNHNDMIAPGTPVEVHIDPGHDLAVFHQGMAVNSSGE
jgi:iron(III) transport system ATP-binding protein